MGAGMYIVKVDDAYHGPFLKEWAVSFAEKASSGAMVLPLFVPRPLGEKPHGITVKIVDDAEYRARNDRVKTETLEVVAGVTQKIFFARREERVLTADELQWICDDLGRAHSAIESLMQHVESTIEDPSPERLVALRRALWRNRGSDDFDPHHSQRNG